MLEGTSFDIPEKLVVAEVSLIPFSSRTILLSTLEFTRTDWDIS